MVHPSRRTLDPPGGIRRVTNGVVAVCGLLTVVASRLMWRKPGWSRAFDDPQLDDGTLGDVVVLQYLGDGDSIPVPGPGFALAAGAGLVIIAVVGLIIGRVVLDVVGAAWACGMLASAAWASDFEGLGPRLFGGAALVASLAALGGVVAPAAPPPQSRWVAVVPLPAAVAGIVCGIWLSDFDPTLRSVAWIAGTVLSFGTTVATAALVARRWRSFRWYVLLADALPAALAGLVFVVVTIAVVT